MRIGRNNYEEYFILYVDNELSELERREVEEFVQRHPDLEEELVMLKQSTLIPDTEIVFDKKEELLKEEIKRNHTLADFEEKLLLYADNELTPQERKQVENFAELYPEIKIELELLMKTKSIPEKDIVFPNKELLYQREGQPKLLRIYWWRLAAAAVVILAIGITIFSLLTGNQPSSPIDRVAESKNLKQPTNSIEVQEKKTPTPPNDDHTNSIAETVVPEKKKVDPQKQDIVFAKNKKGNELRNKEIKSSEVPSNNLPEPGDVIASTKITSQPIAIKQLDEYTPLSKGLVNAQYNVTKGNPISSDQVDASESKTKRFRGLLRKATRILERTAKISATDEDDRLLIGGLTVKL